MANIPLQPKQKRKRKALASVVSFPLFAVACALPAETEQPLAVQEEMPKSESTLKVEEEAKVFLTETGVSLAKAKQALLSYEPGVLKDDCQSEIGIPDKISVKDYGSNTSAPFKGIEWVYHWDTGTYGRTRLVMVFEKYQRDGYWHLNSWSWID